MSETTMPAAEAAVAETNEVFSYELAFHVLPTVAEGEVAGVFDTIKSLITQEGAELTSEEAPERFDLAYDIVKHIEGKNRKFSSAYFGWIRFKSEAGSIAGIIEHVEEHKDILRHLLIKLTRVEEASEFRFHEALEAEKTVTTVEESKVVPDLRTADSSEEENVEVKEESVEVDESELDKALEKEQV